MAKSPCPVFERLVQKLKGDRLRCSPNRATMNPKISSELLRHSIGLMPTDASTNHFNLSAGEFCGIAAKFRSHVARIVCPRTSEQMTRINTCRGVTPMKNHGIVRKIWIAIDDPRVSMGVNAASRIPETETSISHVVQACRPQPASLRFVDLLPKSNNWIALTGHGTL